MFDAGAGAGKKSGRYNAERGVMELKNGLLKIRWDQKFACSVKKVKAAFGEMSRKQNKQAEEARETQQQQQKSVS